MLVQSRHVLALGFRIAPIDVDENPVEVGRSFRASRSFRWRFESCLFREMSRSLVEETGHGRAGAGSVRDFSHLGKRQGWPQNNARAGHRMRLYLKSSECEPVRSRINSPDSRR